MILPPSWLLLMLFYPGSNLDQCGFRGSPTVGVSHESQVWYCF